MLDEILLYLHNWFCDLKDIYFGEYTVADGQLALPFMQDNQYFRICGSVFNDGVYQYPADSLTDETFKGTVWALKIPADFIKLVAEIEEWQEEYGSGSAALGPFQSESFGGYSYSKASVSGSTTSGSSSAVTWMDAFATRLAGWRKM